MTTAALAERLRGPRGRNLSSPPSEGKRVLPDQHFELYERINIGVAVAAADGLFVPTVFDADHKSLGAIAAATRALAGRARAGELTPPELAGGTFTVSNLGMYGIATSRRSSIHLKQQFWRWARCVPSRWSRTEH